MRRGDWTPGYEWSARLESAVCRVLVGKGAYFTIASWFESHSTMRVVSPCEEATARGTGAPTVPVQSEPGREAGQEGRSRT